MTTFWIYILKCENGAYYTGYTRNIARRYRQHVDGTAGVKFTRSFKPVAIAQCWLLTGEMGAALSVEAAIKKFSRKRKLELIARPDRLPPLFAEYQGKPVTITPFDVARAEKAAQMMTIEDIKADTNPFESTATSA
jgi:putative endonuclease